MAYISKYDDIKWIIINKFFNEESYIKYKSYHNFCLNIFNYIHYIAKVNKYKIKNLKCECNGDLTKYRNISYLNYSDLDFKCNSCDSFKRFKIYISEILEDYTIVDYFNLPINFYKNKES